jgi:hypothetical protein
MFDVSQNQVAEDSFTVEKDPIILKFKSGIQG